MKCSTLRIPYDDPKLNSQIVNTPEYVIQPKGELDAWILRIIGEN